MDDTCQVIAVVGPTATGKTDLAQELACELRGEIITADSMQVYAGMDIGTAKHPESERRVPHHCIDMVAPGFPYSAALYQRDARAAIDGLIAQGLTPVVAGGTGLYVRAALDVMEFPPGETSSPARIQLESEAAIHGALAMHDRLVQIDPASADLIHPNNLRRTIRALEMAEEGVSYAQQSSRFARRESFYRTFYLGLNLSRQSLYARIDERVDTMIAAGLLDEVRQLIGAGFREALTAHQAIGYKEMVPVLEDGADLGQAIEDVKRASRRYAKRQLTWFGGDPRVHWIDVEDRGMESVKNEALEMIAEATSASETEPGGSSR